MDILQNQVIVCVPGKNEWFWNGMRVNKISFWLDDITEKGTGDPEERMSTFA